MTAALAPRHHALGAAEAARQLASTGELDEFRLGRNFVRVGDTVHVKPSRPGRHDGFDAKVRRIRGNQAAGAESVDVADPRNGGLRTVPIDRIERRAQTKDGERRG